MTDALIIIGLLAGVSTAGALVAGDMADRPVPWWVFAAFLGLTAATCFLYLLTYHASHGVLP